MKLIHGGLSKHTFINGIQVAVAPKESPPFPVEVMVFEEDTNLILTVDPVIEYEDEHIIRTMTDILEAKQYKPGSVVINGNSWYAVVIDLEQDTVCRKEWCERALDQVFELADKNRVSSLALPLLGSTHGGLRFEEQMTWLVEKIRTKIRPVVKRLWIVCSSDNDLRNKILHHSISVGLPQYLIKKSPSKLLCRYGDDYLEDEDR